ncbi:MAG: DNA-3-methyladenine glycosylase 2 family protein [Xanthobacteraceae bacterium]|nr:DNA-3-methyladenine glycosylase 2 family protein [Xanthobacteraceae bacterium]
MTTHLATQDDLARALSALAVQDPRLQPLLALTGMPALRRREAGFAGLASAICGQQLSTRAAAAIWARVAAAFDPFDHHAVRRARAERLGQLGLSAAKIKTLKAIAGEINKGRLDLAALAEMPADDAHAALTALHGIGPWTADVYLLFCLGHGDAWPAGDLALQEAIRVAFGLASRPTAKAMVGLGDGWRPWRGAAAHLFWAYYRIAKAPGFDALPAAGPTESSPKAPRNARTVGAAGAAKTPRGAPGARQSQLPAKPRKRGIP